MVLSLAFALSAPAHAGAVDCSLAEQDYAEVRRSLKNLRRGQGDRLVVAGAGERCQRAIADIIRNDPFLPITQVIPAAGGNVHTEVRAISKETERCGAVLEGTATGWTLTPVATCAEPLPKENRIVSVGPWLPTGASIRWNENLAGGLSLVADVAARYPQTRQEQTQYRFLGGFDLSRAAGQLSGTYVGMRGGLQRHNWRTSGPEGNDLLFQTIVGQKWIVGPTAAQIGGGLQVAFPGDEGGQQYFEGVVELRVGLAGWQ